MICNRVSLKRRYTIEKHPSRLLPYVNSERPGAAFLGLQVSDIVTPLVSQIFFEKDVLCSQAEQKPKANFLPTSPGSHAATAL